MLLSFKQKVNSFILMPKYVSIKKALFIFDKKQTIAHSKNFRSDNTTLFKFKHKILYYVAYLCVVGICCEANKKVFV